MAPTSATRRRRSKDEARGEILDAARDVLADPAAELSVAAVMAGTTMTRKTFYVHFDDLGDLLVALVRPLRAELDEQLGVWESGDGGAEADRAAAEAAFAAAQDHYRRHAPLLRTVWRLAGSVDGASAARTELLTPFIEAGAAFLQRRSGSDDPAQTWEIARVLCMMNARELLDLHRDDADPAALTARVDAIREIWSRVAGGIG